MADIISDSRMSRRTFLKLLGAGAMIGVMGKVASFATNQRLLASAESVGQWTNNIITTFPSIHTSILKDGRILYVSGTGWFSNRFPNPSTNFAGGPFRSGILSIDSNDKTNSTETMLVPDQPDDLFCCGFAQLADGKILIAGGTTLYDITGPLFKNLGGNFAYEFDPDTNKLYKVSSMAHGRWYPSMGTLPTGKVYCMTGYDETGVVNALSEIYDPVFKTWKIKSDPNTTVLPYSIGGATYTGANPSMSLYARTIIMPSGLVFMGGQNQQMWIWNPSDNTIAGIASGHWVKTIKMTPTARKYGCAILLPLQNTSAERGRVVLAGGRTQENTFTKSVELVDFNAGSDTVPIRSDLTPMQYGRMHTLPVLLPTGKIIIFGGTDDGTALIAMGGVAQSNPNNNYVTFPEMYDPATNTWSTLPNTNSTTGTTVLGRTYHSVALLLKDGSILISSGTPDTGHVQLQTEIFKPWYFFSETRPTISSTPTVGSYGSTISIPTPDASSITKVSLSRLPNQTHHSEAEHRLIWLQIQSNSGSIVVVSAPINANIAPPGYYYLHILKPHSTDSTKDIPSVAQIIHIGPANVSGLGVSSPTIGILSPNARANIIGPSGAVAVKGTAYSPNGIQSVKVSIDSGPENQATQVDNDWSVWTFSTTITAAGPHTINAVATDNLGNKSTASITINIFFV